MKHIRISRGLMLKEAAELVGTNAGNLSRIERGQQNPSLSLARKLADLYGVGLDELLAPVSAPAPSTEAA